MKLVIGSDKSGFTLKETIKSYLIENKIEFEDLGTTDVASPKPYFAVANKVAASVQKGKYDKAILICGTGAGMSVVSNKYKGIYAVACESVYTAKMSRAINDANILCMGGWIIGPEMGLEMAKTFLKTEFLQDLEDWRQAFLINASKEVKKTEEEIYVK